MKIVLMERILEAILLPIDLLCPLGLFFSSKDPTPVVLCFYDYDSKSGNNDVVKLGGSLSVGAWQIEVVKNVVNGGIELGQSVADCTFTKPALETCGAENFQEDQDRE